MATLSLLTKLGLVLESSWASAGTVAVLLPVRNLKTTPADYKQELDDGLRGIAAKDFGAYQGAGSGAVEWEGDFYPEELGALLQMIMGTDTPGAGPPYTHAFTLSSPPKSATIEEAILARQWTGMCLSDFGLKFSASEGKLTYTAKLLGKPSTAVAVQTINSAVLAPFIGWQSTLNVASSGNTRLLDISVDFKRPVELMWTAGNTKIPYAAAIGPLEVTAKGTFDYSTTELGYFTGKTQNTVVLALTYGAAGDQKTLTITATKCDWGDGPAEIDRGKTYTTAAFALRFLYNSTDVGPCAISLKNNTASY